MKRHEGAMIGGGGGTIEDPEGVLCASRFASEVRDRWQHGEPPDVAALLVERPELKRYRSIVLDLAHDEYQHRLKSGEAISAEDFARRFPSLQRSLYLLIEVHKLLESDFRGQQVQRDVPWPQPGQDFLGFTLNAEIGRGTFGRVFLASEPELGNRPVVLKIALQGGQEAKLLGKLDHPNIVPVYSVREDAATGLTAVCMPYQSRATLCDVLDYAFAERRPPQTARTILDAIGPADAGGGAAAGGSPPRLLRKGTYVDGVVWLAAALADGLAYTHSRGICHRDLKPSNVLITADGRPLLLDFNLSFDGHINASRIGGTLPYMAPEQLRSVALGEPEGPDTTDARADLFSLGVIVYELLCGCLPFDVGRWNLSVEEVADRLLEEQRQGPRPIAGKNPHVDRRLARLIESCLAFDPEGRPASAVALATSLRRQIRPLRRAVRWVRDHPRRTAVFALLLSIVVAAGGVAVAQWPTFEQQQSELALTLEEQGEYEQAIKHFTNALWENPGSVEARVGRGRTFAKLAQFQAASKDFEAAFEQTPSGKVAAYLAYCLGRMGEPRRAIDSYKTALDLGYRTPVVLNNLGFVLMQRAPSDAEHYLREAIEADEGFVTAHRNLLLLLVNRTSNEIAKGNPIPASVLQDADRAAKIEGATAELLRFAALLHALAASQFPESEDQAFRYLERAVEMGCDTNRIQRDIVFSTHLDEARLKALAKHGGRGVEPAETPLVVRPF